jgi:hypothetical protein
MALLCEQYASPVRDESDSRKAPGLVGAPGDRVHVHPPGPEPVLQPGLGLPLETEQGRVVVAREFLAELSNRGAAAMPHAGVGQVG